MPPKITHLGANIRFLRRIRGLSQSEFAKSVGLSRNNIASYESGMVEPNSRNFIKMASFFQVNPQDILEKVLSENPVEVVPIDDKPSAPAENYIQEQLEEFTKQTNTFTKILEGYSEFFDLQKGESSTEHERELQNTIDDILLLMEKLASTNWGLIQSVYPSNNES